MSRCLLPWVSAVYEVCVETVKQKDVSVLFPFSLFLFSSLVASHLLPWRS